MADHAPPPPPDNPPTTVEHEAHPSPASPPSEKPASPVSDPPPATNEEDSAPPLPADGDEHSAPAAAVAAVSVIVTESELNEPIPNEDVVAVSTEKSKTVEGDAGQDQKLKLAQSSESFKEETNRVSDLTEHERKSLLELQHLVQEAIDNGGFSAPFEEEKPSAESSVSEISIWGIPLLKDERSDVILLKFLRARDFKVKDAFAMLKNTINWRRVFQIDSLLNEDLGDDLEKVVFMHGHDRDGHPICYNVYGEFQNKELYEKTFGSEAKRERFNRWRIQFLERSIRKLDFNPGGVNTIFQVSDLKNSPGLGKRELRQATDQALQMFQDNYPEFVAKQIFINVPWWYLAFYTMISPFLTQRSKSKFVFAGPAKSAETLFKYISPEQVPVQYGGLSVDDCDCNPEFTFTDPATELTVKPGTKQIMEIIIYEKCVIVWELRVVGWEVTYRAEFVPDAEGEYTMIIQKAKKMAPTDEPVVHGTFSVSELGKLNLIIDNPTSKKKKLLYRFNVKPLSE